MQIRPVLVRFGNTSSSENAPKLTIAAEAPAKPQPVVVAEAKPQPVAEVPPAKKEAIPPKKTFRQKLRGFWDRNSTGFLVLGTVGMFLASTGSIVGTGFGRSHNHRTTEGAARIRLEHEASETVQFLRNAQSDAVKAEKVNAFVGELFTTLAENSPEQAEALLKVKAGMSPTQAKATTEFFSRVLGQNQDSSVSELKQDFNEWFQSVVAKNTSPQQATQLQQAADRAFDKMSNNKSADQALLLGMLCSIVGAAFFGFPLAALALYRAMGPMVR